MQIIKKVKFSELPLYTPFVPQVQVRTLRRRIHKSWNMYKKDSDTTAVCIKQSQDRHDKMGDTESFNPDQGVFIIKDEEIMDDPQNIKPECDVTYSWSVDPDIEKAKHYQWIVKDGPHPTIKLSRAASIQFMREMENPSPPSPALLEAMRKYYKKD